MSEDKKDDMKPIRVRAIDMGYYGDKRRRAGEVFDLVPVKGVKADQVNWKKTEPLVLTPRQQFAKSWMEEVDADEEVSHEESDAKPLHGKKRKRVKSEDLDVI